MHVQSLNGTWKLMQNGSQEVIRASVPGCVHLDLMDAGRIDDPFHGDNEFRVSWVHEADWTYEREFKPDAELLAADRVYLECDGIDTIADVALNGRRLGRVDNMYIRHEFDLTEKLREACNTLRVGFKSPVTFARPHMKKAPLHCPGDSIPGSVYTRKSPCQWGWDWGPQIPTTGIWRPIRLAAYNVARIEDLWVRQKHRNGSVTLNIQAGIERFRKSDCRLTLTLTHPDGRTEDVTLPVNGGKVRHSILITDPQLWWPNGYGSQPLYRVDATLTCDGTELHTQSRKVGLRTLKLEQKKDKWGRSFTFVVNGVPLFCKGADWIPADQFPPRISDEHYRHLIWSAAKANMNMLRVWGGGYYEDERFYDLCDEYGILIWQDFMFSCAQYPAVEWYLANVRKDIEYTVRRLRGRTCLALWCGNNEMEWFLAGGYGGEHNARYREDYSKIFHELLPPIVNKLDPDVEYWPSSPSNGEDYFNDPNAQDRGDGHYWQVWHGRQPFTNYRTQFHRFMSEFGFESLPALETCKSFASEEDLNITSHVMECHQKNRAGNGLILYYLAQTFRFPKDFETMVYVSQLLQAEAMRYGVEHWRRNRGQCMGALYWQLNDCWPVCSWASIDYFGRWKALQYFARRFNEPVLLSVCEEGAGARVHVTNDTTLPVDAEVRWSLERLDGTVLKSDTLSLQVAGCSDKAAAKLDFAKELKGDALRQTVLVSELHIGGRQAALVVTPFVPSKHLELPEAKISTTVKTDASGPYIEVTSDVTARYVCLSIPGQDVVLSDNYLDLPAKRTVIVRPETPIDPAALGGIRSYSLRDSY